MKIVYIASPYTIGELNALRLTLPPRQELSLPELSAKLALLETELLRTKTDLWGAELNLSGSAKREQESHEFLMKMVHDLNVDFVGKTTSWLMAEVRRLVMAKVIG
jgi:hypothetical protein